MAIGGPQQTTEEPDDEEPETILEVQDANVRFDMPRGQAVVIDDVDLEIRRGEIFAIAGESGAGKSTFATALMDAVEEPGVLTGSVTYYPDDDDGDEVTVDDVDTYDLAMEESIDLTELTDDELKSVRWEEIAMVFQGATK